MISVTDLSAYQYCGRKLFLERVLHVVEPPKDVLVLGSIRHNTYDKINKKEEEIIRMMNAGMQKSDVFDIYRREYIQLFVHSISQYKQQLTDVNLVHTQVFKKYWHLFLDEAVLRADIVSSFVEKGLFGEDLWNAIVPKIESEVRMSSEQLKLKGIIDQIERYKDSMIPVELKTGSMPATGVWPGHRIQISAYALLIEEQCGTVIPYGKVRYLDSKKTLNVPINSFVRMEVIDIVDKTISVLNSAEPPSVCQNKNKCRSCTIQNLCSDTRYIKERCNVLMNAPVSSRK